MLLVRMIIPFNHHDHIMLWNTSPWNPSKNPYCWWWIPPQMDMYIYIIIYICICLDCIPIQSHQIISYITNHHKYMGYHCFIYIYINSDLYHSFDLPSRSTVKPSAELTQAVRTLSPGSWARVTGCANCRRLKVKETCGSIELKKHVCIYIYRSNILDTVRYGLYVI
jgi:hypothetical protein